MSTLRRSKALFDEGRIDLAYHDLHNGKYKTPYAAANAFNVSPKKFKRRLDGIEPRCGLIAKN
jgi:hypothetical protein